MNQELKRKLAEARTHERFEERPCYVYWSVLTQHYELTERMPFMGEWYTSDGIQHGVGMERPRVARSEKFYSDL
jgi:hypothetical protein